jgi:hypothetical protein
MQRVSHTVKEIQDLNPLYLLEMTPYDFHSFGPLKKALGGGNFRTYE